MSNNSSALAKYCSLSAYNRRSRKPTVGGILFSGLLTTVMQKRQQEHTITTCTYTCMTVKEKHSTKLKDKEGKQRRTEELYHSTIFFPDRVWEKRLPDEQTTNRNQPKKFVVFSQLTKIHHLSFFFLAGQADINLHYCHICHLIFACR